MNPERYPDVAPLLQRLQAWDRKANPASVGAGTFAIFYHQLTPLYRALPSPKIIPPATIHEALVRTKKYMLKHFKTLEVPLGDYQKLVRGSKEIPIFGLPDVVTAMASIPHREGKVKVVSGESYIELVRFTSEGPEIESVISYGSSDHSDSPHFGDQMELYANFKTKKMTLDKEIVLANAVKRYHPK